MTGLELIGLGSGIASIFGGANAQSKANRLQQQALQMAQQQYAERAPFRQQALGMLQQVEGDTGLPADFGVNRGNPYARTTRVSTAMPLPAVSMASSPIPAPMRGGWAGMVDRARQQIGARQQAPDPNALAGLVPLTGRR